MAGINIDELPAALQAELTDVYPVDQLPGPVTKQVSTQQLLDLFGQHAPTSIMGTPDQILVNGSSLEPSVGDVIISLDIPVGISEGGTGVTSVTTSPIANAWAGWDSNFNFSSNNFLGGFVTTVTSGGSSSLTVNSPQLQYFTGSSSHTVTLPVIGTLGFGHTFYITNLSSGTINIQSSGGNTLQSMAPSTTLIVTYKSSSGSGVASWSWVYLNNSNGQPFTNVIYIYATVSVTDPWVIAANYTYNNGSSGVGATITNNTNGVLEVDTTNPPVGSVILFACDTVLGGIYNGIYTVTNAGSVGTPFVLTRVSYFDTPSEINNFQSLLVPIHGDQNLPGVFMFNSLGTAVTAVGVDGINFNQLLSQVMIDRNANNPVFKTLSVFGEVVFDNSLEVNLQVLANRFTSKYDTFATAGGTTVLNVDSVGTILLTGTLNETIQLPVTSTLPNLNWTTLIINSSSGIVTINSSGGNLIVAMAPNTQAVVRCILLTGTTAASWSVEYASLSGVTPQQVQQSAFNFALDTGSVPDEYEIALSPAVTALTDGFLVSFSTTSSNTSIDPTLKINSLSPVTIVNQAGVGLLPNDIGIGPLVSLLIYDAGLGSFILLNPAVSMVYAQGLINNFYLSGTDSGAANAYVYTPNSNTGDASPNIGESITFSATNTNTTASTITISTLGGNFGPTAVYLPNDGALPAGAITVARTYTFIYTTTQGGALGWVIQNPSLQGSIITQPPVSATSSLAIGTAFQNTTGHDIILTVYLSITAATTASVLLGVGTTSTPTQQTIVSSLSTAALSIVTVPIYIPHNYYAKLSTSGTITLTISGQHIMSV